MRPNSRAILERCIEDGISHGLHRAYKHVDTPSESAMVDAISSAIWLEIDCYFNFEDDVL